MSRYFWKQRQFTPQTSVHTYITFSGTKNVGFRNQFPERSFSKTLALIFFFVWKDEDGGYFRIPRCHTSYSVWHEWDAIEAAQKIISFFQNIRIRVDETCVVSYHYSHTRIIRMTKVIDEPLRSHDSGRFLVQSILSCRELWSTRVYPLRPIFRETSPEMDGLKHSTFLKIINKQQFPSPWK